MEVEAANHQSARALLDVRIFTRAARQDTHAGNIRNKYSSQPFTHGNAVHTFEWYIDVTMVREHVCAFKAFNATVEQTLKPIARAVH